MVKLRNSIKDMPDSQKKKVLMTWTITAVVFSILLLVLIFINAVRC